VEDLAAKMLITGGLKAWRPANVSSRLITCNCMPKQWLLSVCPLFSLTNAHMWTPAASATTTVRPVCRKCGTIAKSRKSSCCGRGGSWFRNCGKNRRIGIPVHDTHLFSYLFVCLFIIYIYIYIYIL
jgi:hypothetical protein